MVKYNYDAWGNCNVIATDSYITLANLNPYRYRSYYYDTETGLYFLKTRYYDPQVGRFISIDNISYVDFDNINGINLYAYCGNNPVMDIDPDGTWSWKRVWKVVAVAVVAVVAVVASVATFGAAATALAVGIGSIVGASSYIISTVAMGEKITLGGFLGATLGGALGGILSLTGINSFGLGFFSEFSTSIFTTLLEDAFTGNKTNYKIMFNDAVNDGIIAGVLFSGFNKIKIKGLNSGRGSISQVSKQIKTKLINRSIRKISVNTFGKMLALNLYEEIPGILRSILEDFAYDRR